VQPRHAATDNATPHRLPAFLRVSPAALLGAALFLAMSLTPALYPRAWTAQGVLSGIAVALGALTGGAVGSLGGRIIRRQTEPRRVWARRLAGVVAAAVAAWAAVVNHQWQLDVGRLMGIAGNPAPRLAAAVAVAVAVGYVLLLLARAVGALLRRYARLVRRVVPRRGVRAVLHLAVTALLLVGFVDVVIAGRMVAALNDRMIASDARIQPEVVQPRSPQRSGSPASLVSWDSLGRMGRAFVADGPTQADLRSFAPGPVLPPIRVYAGLGSADTDAERAALAVAELERTGGFERDVLVIVVPTGTGAVNRHAIAPLEYMYRGSTAAVAIQYSYRPSWVVVAGNQERAKHGARALFGAVTERLAQLPAGSRPRLLLYGESLGSFGGEHLFTGVDDIREQVEGVLWVGPPRANPIWRELTTARDPGSPVWQPVYDGGHAVRFGARAEDLRVPDTPWTSPRIAYLQHPSDPVTWWSPDLFSRRPDWLDATRPADISYKTPYVPVVTGVQTAIDTALGGGAPVGHGHIYATEQAEAWALVAQPDGWAEHDTARLVQRLDEVP
jgi:uncharacterized membrane protein